MRRLDEPGLGQCPDRHHRAAAAAHIDTIDVLDRIAELRLGLDIDLPSAAEQVEIVYVKSAKRRLQRVEDVADLDPEHLRLVAVDVEADLRCVGGEGAEVASEFGLLVGGDQEAAHHSGNVVGALSLQRLERVLETAGTAEADDRRQIERKHDGALDCAELRSQTRDNGIDRLRWVGPFFVRL